MFRSWLEYQICINDGLSLLQSQVSLTNENELVLKAKYSSLPCHPMSSDTRLHACQNAM